MDVGVLGVMIPIVALIGGYIMVIYLRKYDNQERMAMIDKGVDPQFFHSKSARGASGALRASLLLIGVGLGLLMGQVMNEIFYMNEAGYFSMVFIFGGIGLGLSYIIEEKKLREEKNTDK